MAIFVFLPGCADKEQCYFNGFLNVTSYEIHQTGVTPKGLMLDDPQGLLDVERLDSLVAELEECLGMKVKPNCITVKVPPDLYLSPCTGKWLFLCDIDDQLCRTEDKGLEPTEECPCNCRGAIQDENVIVIEPNLETFKGELTRMLTGISNPWIHPLTCECL